MAERDRAQRWYLRGHRETSYIGRLGVESLAAMALVFTLLILTMTMSGGAMVGVASAIARHSAPEMSIAPRRSPRTRY